jgi:hypothetical protein
MADERDRLRKLRQLEAEATATAKPSIANDPYYIRDPKTGLSPAQVEANKLVTETAESTGRRVITGATGATATANRIIDPLKDKSVKPSAPEGYRYTWIGGTTTGEWKLYKLPPAPSGGGGGSTEGGGGGGAGGGGGGGGKTFTASDGTVFTDQNAYVTYENNLRTKKLAADSAAAAATAERKSAYDLLYSQFAKYGLQSLVAPLEGLIKEGVPASEFAIRLRETDGYKQRFAANQARIKKGLSALSEAEYIGLEDAYQGIMRQYGMPESYYTRGELGRQEGFEKFIGGDVSPAELETRISTAYNRVINANPEVVQALKQFYPNITNGDILSYALDPEKALTDINKKVTAAEIGAGAMQAGLTTGLARAEELQRYGVTKETAQQGFGTIASGLERGRQLSNIYQQPTYTQEVAETEVFALPDAEKARRQRRRLGQLETATFSGTTGMTGGALDRERAGQY